MKARTAIVVCALTLATTVVGAEETHHEGSAPGEAKAGAMGMMHEGGMPMMDMKTMEEHMEKMQAIMAQAKAAKDPKERQALLKKHRQEMHASMNMMNGMMMPEVSGGAMGGGPKTAPDAKQMQQQHQMMQQRMNMMQKMMENMLDQQAMTEE